MVEPLAAIGASCSSWCFAKDQTPMTAEATGRVVKAVII